MKIRVINGPNLNLLGQREPEIYGKDSLEDIKNTLTALGKSLGAEIDFLQSNHEGEIIDWIQQCREGFDGLIINPAAYTHSSVALHDALLCFEGLKYEVHISNPHARETFRQTSYVSPAVNGVIAGLGVTGYEVALKTMVEKLSSS